MFAPLPHHISARGAFAFEIFGDDSVIADQRKGLQNDLPCITGVGQRFNISAHAGGEYQFSHGGVRCAERNALNHFAVGKDKVPLHASAPPIMAAVHENGVRRGVFHQRFVYLIRGKRRDTIRPYHVRFSHGNPDIGINHLRIPRGFYWV